MWKPPQRIVSQPNDFYRALARGAEHAASIYGGLDFALAFGGNEMPGYHTGPGCHLGYLTGARHSHLDSAGYSLDQKAAAKGEALTPDGVAERPAGRRALAPGADQPGGLPVCPQHVRADMSFWRHWLPWA
jgi:aldehyde:ferredoxin oxidoreductase